MLHNPNPGGNKEKCHILQQKIGFFPNVVGTKKPGEKQQKQQNHGDNASGKGDGEKQSDSFSQKAYAQYQADLYDDFHSFSRLSIGKIDSMLLYHRGEKMAFRISLHLLQIFGTSDRK